MTSRVNRSLALSAVDSYLGAALQLASTVLISRLLTPEQVGVFAVAAVFAALATMFRDFGIAEYLIQERQLTGEKMAAAYTLGIVLSWSMALAMFGGSFAASSFFGNAGIGQVMRVLAANFLLIPFGAIGLAYFRRQMDFRPILICNAAGHVVGFAAAVTLALGGFGYMSLAWSSLLATVAVVVASLLLRPAEVPVRPGWKGIAEVFHFSKFASGIYLFSQAGKGAPEIIIGRVAGVVDVAMYSRANGIVELFNRIAIRPVTRVCMPYFARHDEAGGSVPEAYGRSVSYLTAVGWPFLVFMALEAEAAIRLIYGPQWEAAVPLARILCIACAVELVHLLAREVLLAMGQARRANQLQMGLLALQLTGLCAVLPYGLAGAAWGVLAASVTGLFLSQWHLRRGLLLPVRPMVQACRQAAVLTAAALGPLLLWRWQGTGLMPAGVLHAAVGGLLTTAAWLVALRALRHPLHDQLAPLVSGVWQRLRGGAGVRGSRRGRQ